MTRLSVLLGMVAVAAAGYGLTAGLAAFHLPVHLVAKGLVICTIGFAGASVASSRPRLGALLMLGSSLAILYLTELEIFTGEFGSITALLAGAFPPTVGAMLLLLAAILGLIARRR